MCDAWPEAVQYENVATGLLINAFLAALTYAAYFNAAWCALHSPRAKALRGSCQSLVHSPFVRVPQ